MPHAKRTATGVFGGLLGLVGLSAVAGLLVTATVTPAIAVTGYAASSAITMFDNLPSYLEVTRPMEPTTLYATNPDTGKSTELTSFYDQNRTPVEHDEIATVMYDAILSSEDPRYYEHGGIDLIGTTRAIISNMQGGADLQGGSSISQQYVKNVLIQRCEQQAEDQKAALKCWHEATESEGMDGIERKLQEMRYAIQIEQEYSKNEILLGYLNIANFGGTTYGIEAAAQYYYGVHAKDLKIGQAATLAGIVQNPNQYRIDQPNDEDNGAESGYPQTKTRQSYVLYRMFVDGKITEKQYEKVREAPIEPDIHPRETGCIAAGSAAYFCQYVKTVIQQDPAFGETPEERRETLSRGGLNIYTTIDPRVQETASGSMHYWTPTHIDGMDFGATAVTIEADSGRILAMAQNTKFSEDADLVTSNPGYSAQVYAADAAHGSSNGFPVGSTYKLFTLLEWLEQGRSVNEVIDATNRVFNMNCDGVPINGAGTEEIGNFGGGNGGPGTIMNFTRQSLNTGFLAMAEQLNLCDINRLAERMGVHLANGGSVTDQNVPFDVLGSKYIAPIQMAGAYATVANNGVFCTPRAIDKITDADGNELPLPESECSQVIEPNVAATGAYALQGVMNGGTGAAANPGDGTPLIGKTGTHNVTQSMMIESSTKAATAVAVGNVQGSASLYSQYYQGMRLVDLRYQIARDIQGTANQFYAGKGFPSPDQELTKKVLKDLPSVIGMSQEQATKTLQEAGFGVRVGSAEPGTEEEGLITRQDPGAGQVAGGTTVTIYPSNGKGLEIPTVAGLSPSQAVSAVLAAGFSNVSLGSCERNEDADSRTATGTSPEAGEVASAGADVTVNYEAENCGSNGNGQGPSGDAQEDDE